MYIFEYKHTPLSNKLKVFGLVRFYLKYIPKVLQGSLKGKESRN